VFGWGGGGGSLHPMQDDAYRMESEGDMCSFGVLAPIYIYFRRRIYTLAKLRLPYV
jgi:hypothetical protein